MELRVLKLVVAGIIVMAISASASPTVYVSNPFTPSTTESAYFSYGHNGTLFNQCYTDVDYDGSYRITDFHWWGTELGIAAQDLNGFRLQIFTNDGSDMPGAQVYSEFFGNSSFTVNDGPDIFDAKYGVDLTTPFAAAAGKYWFSVTADFTSLWSWGWTISQTTRLGHDDWQYYQDFNDNWVWAAPEPGDLTFEVTGENLVPEPASLTLFGMGLFGGLAAIRRRKK